jgi:hypothetical protein
VVKLAGAKRGFAGLQLGQEILAPVLDHASEAIEDTVFCADHH